MPFLSRILMLFFVSFWCLTSHSFAGPVVLFDEAHGQQFLVGNNGPLDLSDLAAHYESNGFSVVTQAEPLTKDVLADVDILVISGPFLPLADSELIAVMDFVESGGGLAVMLHVATPVRDLLYRLEIDFTNGSLRGMDQLIDDNHLNFKVDVLADHPVTAGLESFSVYGCWALRGTAPHAQIVAETGQHAWVDLDHDGQLSQADAVQQFGVMVAGEAGKGRYVVLGDDALFQNRFLDEDNRQLALQLLNWLALE